MTAGAAAPALSEPEPDPLAWLPDLESAPRYVEPDRQLGAFSVNAAGLELLRALVRDDPAAGRVLRAQLARAIRSRDAAEHGGLATYGLPAWPVTTSLDTRQQVRRQVPRRRLDPGVKARQRDRYKRAAADALDAFARQHRRRDPRVGDYRPRWLDHRHDCHSGYCSGCASIPVPAGPRWRRGHRRDMLLRRAIPVSEWLADRASAMRSCREAIGLRDRACGGVMVVPQSCHVRTCPDCEAARQTRVVGAYRAAVEALDGDRVRFVTLTLRNVPRGELAAGLDALGAAVGRLRRRALWRGGRCRDRSRCRMPADPDRPGWRLPHEPIAAELASTEVTYNAAAATWHPHAHLLVEGPYVPQDELAEAWQELTGSSRIVWIESVRRHADQEWAGDVTAALRELLKYAAKPTPAFLSERDPDVLGELLVALRGRHLTSSAGKLYGAELGDDPEPADLVLVLTDDPAAEPYRAPRVCPMHGDLADWEVAGHVPRHLCRPAPARAGPFASVLVLPDRDTQPVA